jgi:hypothetical protein
MQLECLIQREGPTTVILESMKYIFMPIPGSKKGEITTSVCEITTERHVQHLLATGQYREYDQERAIREAKERSKQKSKFEGYAIEKYLDAGYVCVKKGQPLMYAGPDGLWRKERSGSYFKTEIEAYNFLREELETEETDENPSAGRPGRPRKNME